MPTLLLASSSKAQGSDYLAPVCQQIQQFLPHIKDILFIPYAAVSFDYDEYLQLVSSPLQAIGISVTAIHQYKNPQQAIIEASAIIVGGGNTFRLLEQLYAQSLLAAIQQKVNDDTPYIGWSAGANIAGLSIKTTNDMPIVQPPSFSALALVPYQINPHYIETTVGSHHGETREQRLAEFMQLNSKTPIVALPEGNAIFINDKIHTYIGQAPGYYFYQQQKSLLTPGDFIPHPAQ